MLRRLLPRVQQLQTPHFARYSTVRLFQSSLLSSSSSSPLLRPSVLSRAAQQQLAQPHRNMFIVAVTGGIATGKSTVTKVFRDEGVPIVDADLIAREVVEPGKPAWKKIRKEFGDAVLNNDKSINRAELGKLIFADAEKRKFLNSATHPEIHGQMYREIWRHALAGHAFVLVDLPLLFETGAMLPYVHKIITVVCEEDLQLTRLMDRNQYSEADAKVRIAAQMPLDTKCKQSHFVIENSGTVADTEEQTRRILVLLRQSKQHWRMRAYVLATAVVFFGLLAWLLNFKYGFLDGILDGLW